MQPLKRIKQLGFTDLVYPSATHTRFEHSLGTLCVADKIAERIGLEKKERRTLRKNFISKSSLEIPMCRTNIEKILQTDYITFLNKMQKNHGIASETAKRLLSRNIFKVGYKISMEKIDFIKRVELIKNWATEGQNH